MRPVPCSEELFVAESPRKIIINNDDSNSNAIRQKKKRVVFIIVVILTQALLRVHHTMRLGVLFKCIQKASGTSRIPVKILESSSP
jgi:hypothetical protein